jgi:hypothetical protein
MGRRKKEPGQELPWGWMIARDRPHGLVEAIRRSSSTEMHVIVARDKAELLDKLRAAASRDPLAGAENEMNP